MKNFKKKGPVMAYLEGFYHWAYTLMHNAAVVAYFFAAHAFQRLKHPHDSLDLAATDFFLFRMVKEELADLSLNQDSLKNAGEEVTNTIIANEFFTAFQRRYQHYTSV